MHVCVEQTWNTARGELQRMKKVKEEGEREGKREGEAGVAVGEGGNSEEAESGKETNGDDLDSGGKSHLLCVCVYV